MKALNRRGRSLIRRLCRKTHPAEILSMVRDYCQRQWRHGQMVSDLRAIDAEWKRAVALIDQAIEEIAP